MFYVFLMEIKHGGGGGGGGLVSVQFVLEFRIVNLSGA